MRFLKNFANRKRAKNQIYLTILCLTLIATLFTFGCSTNEIYESWKGAPVSELVTSWGKPQKIKLLKSGGKIYIYDRTPGETKKNYLDNYTGPTKLTGYYVNKNGIIYKWEQKPLADSLFD